MFGRNLEADAPAPIIEREHLKAGAVVQHKGTHQVKTANGPSVKHTFRLVGAPDNTPWLALWGSANLNSQLRKAKPGSVLLLRYRGQDNNPDGSPGAHLWDVKPSNVSLPQLLKYLESPERQTAIRELATVIQRAHEADRERRQAQRESSSPFGPPHDDDDIPF